MQMKLLMMTHGDRHSEGEGSYISPRHSPYTKPSGSYIQRQQLAGYYKSYEDFQNQPTSPLNLSNHNNAVAQYMSLDTDDMLLDAAEEHLRPLIKKELRYTIQNKRMAKGLPKEVNIDFSVKDNEVCRNYIFINLRPTVHTQTLFKLEKETSLVFTNNRNSWVLFRRISFLVNKNSSFPFIEIVLNYLDNKYFCFSAAVTRGSK